MIDKHERLLDYLAGADGWVTAAELADRLGVTTRSVRSYVTAVKSSSRPYEVIASSTSGYRLNREVYATFVSGAAVRTAERPRDRQYHLVRRLGDAPDGLDIFALAESLFVSESTIEADLRKIKGVIEETDLRLARRGTTVTLSGSEVSLRRLLSRMFQDDDSQGFLELESIQREFESENLRPFKTDLIGVLNSHGFFVNEYGINHVLLHVAIAIDRTAKEQQPMGAGQMRAEAEPGIPADLAELALRHFGVMLTPLDLDYLTVLLTTRVITPGVETDEQRQTRSGLADDVSRIRHIVRRVSEEYLVDLDDEDFMLRLSLHVRNLVARAHDKSYSRNPMSRSIKTSYPMIYEIAVFIASEIQRQESVVIHDDEISYIALHVGSYLERQAKREERVTCAIVCPGYYDLHDILRERLVSVLGSEIEIEIVITRTDVDWADLATDLILTTISARAVGENVIVIQPFPTESDFEAIRRAASRVRRQRRRAQLKDELMLFFDESLFLRDFHAPDEESMIRELGARMVTAGIIDPAYIDGAIERERMSSTAFTDNIAVPHALQMTAERTAICIAVNETPMTWGDNRVNVVALIAFSSSGRATFQAIFDQFVSVFSDRDDVQQLVRGATDFPAFIDELLRGIDK